MAIMEQRIRESRSLIRPRAPMTLPVVFHVVYRDAEHNISDLQIQSQIDILNRDMAFMADNIFSIPDEFVSLGADADMFFCLASRDPDGNPTTGITRTSTVIEDIGTHSRSNGRNSVHYASLGGKDGWDPSRYINIWVAPMDGLLGNASLPGMAAFPEEDGIVVDPEFLGSVGLAADSHPFHRGHTLTHEVGHYLGLYHIWGPGNGNCAVDDMVDDTPEQERPYLGCPEYPQFSCGSSDLFMNFMDFTNDNCLALFTRGQIERMQGTLLGIRSGLLDNSDACAIPDSGKIGLEDAIIFYADGSDQIIIVLGEERDQTKELLLYAMDGRFITRREWLLGKTFWMDGGSLPGGIYILQLKSGDESVVRKVFVTH
jgi:hypothetical protein